jgi:SAM-dependent methyltransferase
MSHDLVADYYRRHHSRGAKYGFTFGGQQRVDWFKQHVGTGLKLLDLGCRDGTLTAEYAPGNEVIGVDIDDAALERCRQRLGIETLQLNLNSERLPFADGSLDVVITAEILEHLQFPDDAVAEVHRVLAPGGLFLGSVPNSFRLKNRLRFLMGRDFELDPTHLHHFSPGSLRKLVSRFTATQVQCICSRYLWFSPSLMGNDMVWACRK